MGSNSWKDVTSYSQRDKEHIPATWELRSEQLTVVVTRHIYRPGKWCLSCRQLGIDLLELSEDDEGEAKEKALAICVDKANQLRDEATTLYRYRGKP